MRLSADANVLFPTQERTPWRWEFTLMSHRRGEGMRDRAAMDLKPMPAWQTPPQADLVPPQLRHSGLVICTGVLVSWGTTTRFGLPP
jgi:hypothetical protein